MATNLRDRGDRELLSVAHAAGLLGVHPNTIRAWTDAGRLSAYRINPRGDRRYRRSDVERLLTTVATPPPSTRSADEAGGAVGGELAVLRTLAGAAAATPDPRAICRATADSLHADAGWQRVAIYLRDGEAMTLAAHVGHRSPPAERLDDAPPADETGLDAPLRSGTEQIGLLRLVGAPPTGRDQPAFAATVASALAVAVRNARLLARSRRELTRARALRAVTQELTGTLDLNVVLDDIVDRTRSLFDADKAGLWLLGDGPLPVEPASHHELGQGFIEAGRSLTMETDTISVRAIREQRLQWLRNAHADPAAGWMRQQYAAEGIRTVCIVPLVVQGQAVGVLGLYHQRDHIWPDDELALVRAFASQAAVAIQNARLYRSVEEQAARMQSIQDLSARLNRLTDVGAIAEAIVAEASSLADYHDIRVYAVDWQRRVCEPVAYTDRMLGEGDFRERLRVEIGDGSFTGWVAAHGEPLLINNALDDPRGMTIEGTDDIPESMLVVPMVFEGRAVGVIVLSQLGFDRFTGDDLQTMTIFAGYAAQAVANARAYARLAQQSDELARRADSQRRLLEINERLLSTFDQAGVLETIADGLQRVVSHDNLSVYRADHARQVLSPVLTREQHADQVGRYEIPFGRGLMGWAIDNAEAVCANDALADPRALQIPGTPPDPEAVIVVPLVADGTVIGALNISRVGGEEVHFSEADFELVKLFAGQASIALRNADEHRAVSVRAETDALTGLRNHGAFQRDLAEYLERAASHPPSDEPFAVLMMDLDEFKAFNDLHGHPAGDALLHAVGVAIYGAARSEDSVYRYGGDEFALILPSATMDAAEPVAHRIRSAVDRLTAGDRTPVTITVGIASYPADALDRAGLIAAADTALYHGKRSGADCVTRADEVPDETRDLRGTLDQLQRGALLHPAETAAPLGHADLADGDGPTPFGVPDALLAVARSLESAGRPAWAHQDRVGRLAAMVAARLGLDDDAARSVELAGRLHGPHARDIEEVERVPSLAAVAAVLREARDLGAGEARGLTGSARASREGQVVAAANAYDALVRADEGVRIARSEALRRLRAELRGVQAEVLDALASVVADGPDRGRRRRQADRRQEAEGAA